MLDADQIEAFIGMDKPVAPEVPPGPEAAARTIPDPRAWPPLAGFAGLFAKIRAKP